MFVGLCEPLYAREAHIESTMTRSESSILPTPEPQASRSSDHTVWTRMRGAVADGSPGERGSAEGEWQT
jgi:hypothetical protein